ncbi:hypothetical protein MPSEU_000596400 [Mayamaea pseudoterrestris]|nr:hypothetical protein MPSEU_000596400 [Mayamaea pseudoterrestris]
MTTTPPTSNAPQASNEPSKHPSSSEKKQIVAVIGGGVAGLSAAWHLHVNCNDYQVYLYEACDRLGGHAWTVPVVDENNKAVDVDIGFMVFNQAKYPNMVEWFQALNVTAEDSDMSLSVSLDQGESVEWSSNGLFGLLAKPTQLLQPSFYMFLLDMVRFNAQAPQLLLLPNDDPRKHATTAQYLRTHHYSQAFTQYYLLPMMAALWSASLSDVLQFPAAQLIGFLCNHRMLQLFDRPLWKTVQGRSQMYTNKLQHEIFDPAQVFVSASVQAVEKLESGQYRIVTNKSGANGDGLVVDHVIFACHPPTAHAILKRGNAKSNNFDSVANLELLDCLSKIDYADNVIYVHSDPKLMPKRRQAWASWNCLGKSEHLNMTMESQSNASKGSFEGAESGFGNTLEQANGNDNNSTVSLEGADGRMKAVFVTYWLNRLQNLETDKNIFVSLNPHEPPAPELTHKRVIMAHPQFDPATLAARNKIEQMQGQHNIWFCGAWSGYGFHEDGCRSGFQVATALSETALPWAKQADQPVLAPPDLSLASAQQGGLLKVLMAAHQRLTYDWPVSICRRFVYHFLKSAVQQGTFRLRLNDGTIKSFGDGTPCGCDDHPVTLRVFDEWFFVKVALEYDLGLARSYMAGHFVVEPLKDSSMYHQTMKPSGARDETNLTLGDPIGLTRLFLLLVGNRDRAGGIHVPRKSGRGNTYSNALTNASGLILAKIGSLFNYVRYKLTMDNSERGGSLRNIHAHYDLSNDLFTSFLDKEHLMYSCGIWDAIPAPTSRSGLIFRGTLEEAQTRKLDNLLERAQVKPGQTVLDIGFGWGGLSIRAAKRFGCKVTGITLSVEQQALAEKRVKEMGLDHLITFEVVDYRTFARRLENKGKFDRVLSCEMIEAVGHEHLGEFFWAVEQLLSRDGVLVMQAITTPEERYETYRRSTDFINTIIFPGSCCPSLHALTVAMYRESTLCLEHIDNIGLHYAETLAEWRRRFNANESIVRSLGFDDVFLRAWNYYLTYCEAGFFSQTENCLQLVFARPGCRSLVPLCETRSVKQAPLLTKGEIQNWINA